MDKASCLKINSYVTVSVGLFIAYACTFGQNSIRRYLEHGVIITEHEEVFDLSSIQPPGKNFKYLQYLFYILYILYL